MSVTGIPEAERRSTDLMAQQAFDIVDLLRSALATTLRRQSRCSETPSSGFDGALRVVDEAARPTVVSW